MEFIVPPHNDGVQPMCISCILVDECFILDTCKRNHCISLCVNNDPCRDNNCSGYVGPTPAPPRP